MKDQIIDTFTDKIRDAEISVLMPVHNEGETIGKTTLGFYETISVRMPVEIVLSEDGSTDNTKKVIASLSQKMPLKAILSPIRKGYAGGIKDGLRLVTSKYVLITDSDGQHDPKDFWKLWKFRSKYDIISGLRKHRADSFYRKLMSKMFQLQVRSVFRLPNFADMTAPFKLMETEVAMQIANKCKYMSESFWNEFTVRAYYAGYRIYEVPVNHQRRADKSDTRVYKPWKIPKISIVQLKALYHLRMELYDCK